MAAPLPDFEGALNAVFRGRATWNIQRDVRRDTLRVGFQCTEQTPQFEITQTMLEDAIAPASTLAHQCIEFYERHHKLLKFAPVSPILTCRECRAPVDVPHERKLSDYEFCERQSVLWAERAAKAVR